MDTWKRNKYLQEVRFECKCALQALHYMRIAFYQDRTSDAFGQIQNFLTHAAVISMIFWPTKKSNPRGAILRKSLNLPEDSKDHPLGDRGIRNDLIHYDERLDTFFSDVAPDTIVIDLMIGVTDGIIIDGENPSRYILRRYEPKTGIFVFRNNEINLLLLENAVRSIDEAAEAILSEALS